MRHLIPDHPQDILVTATGLCVISCKELCEVTGLYLDDRWVLTQEEPSDGILDYITKFIN